jgi:hypothetical protein
VVEVGVVLEEVDLERPSKREYTSWFPAPNILSILSDDTWFATMDPIPSLVCFRRVSAGLGNEIQSETLDHPGGFDRG